MCAVYRPLFSRRQSETLRLPWLRERVGVPADTVRRDRLC